MWKKSRLIDDNTGDKAQNPGGLQQINQNLYSMTKSMISFHFSHSPISILMNEHRTPLFKAPTTYRQVPVRFHCGLLKYYGSIPIILPHRFNIIINTTNELETLATTQVDFQLCTTWARQKLKLTHIVWLQHSNDCESTKKGNKLCFRSDQSRQNNQCEDIFARLFTWLMNSFCHIVCCCWCCSILLPAMMSSQFICGTVEGKWS